MTVFFLFKGIIHKKTVKKFEDSDILGGAGHSFLQVFGKDIIDHRHYGAVRQMHVVVKGNIVGHGDGYQIGGYGIAVLPVISLKTSGDLLFGNESTVACRPVDVRGSSDDIDAVYLVVKPVQSLEHARLRLQLTALGDERNPDEITLSSVTWAEWSFQKGITPRNATSKVWP